MSCSVCRMVSQVSVLTLLPSCTWSWPNLSHYEWWSKMFLQLKLVLWQVLECYLTASYTRTLFLPCCSKHISTVANTERRRRSNALRCDEVSTGVMWLCWSNASSEVLKAFPEKICSLSHVDFLNLKVTQRTVIHSFFHRKWAVYAH